MSTDLSMPILVVEDSHAMGLIVCGLLKQLGLRRIDLAHGGATALAKMRKAEYGLVLSEWNMHPMSGIDLLKQIRSETALANTRFIMMSAAPSMDQVVAARTAGADSFIVKPFTAQVLEERICSMVPTRNGEDRVVIAV